MLTVHRESNSAKQHKMSHTCSAENPCTTHSNRHMENDDWVKFGYVLWATRNGVRKGHVLELYGNAWKKIYSSEPLLEDGGPVNFLWNPQYTCAKPVPWLSVALAEDIEAPIGGYASTNPAGPPNPTSLPDTAGPSDIAKSGPSPSPQSDDQVPAISGSQDSDLDKVLKSVQCKVIHQAPPRIQDGFFPGFVSYLEASESHQRLYVVFPIIPQYRIDHQDYKPTSDVSLMELDPDDVEEINKAERGCLYAAKDQANCQPGRLRYFCSSWVSMLIKQKISPLTQYSLLWVLR